MMITLKDGQILPSLNRPAMFTKKVTKQSEQSEEIAEEAVTKQRSCVHFDKCVDLDKLLKTIKSCQEIKCGECNQGVHVKEKKRFSFSNPEKKAVWLCLECGYYSCGGVGLPTGGNSHVVRHMRLTRHRLVIQCENPKLRWCFSCQSLVPFDKEENGEKKDLLLEVVKAIKERCPGSGSSSRSISEEIKKLKGSSVSSARHGYYGVRGLVNLGNTCFFNSVLQNLLSLDQLRDHLLKDDDDDVSCCGPLVSSLKKLFAETKSEAGLFKSVINPREFFGSVCCKAPQFRGCQQHDSHELLRCLLDGLSIEESSLRKKLDSDDDACDSHEKPTLIDSVFGGEVSSTVSCLECGHSSKVYEPFLDLSLPLPSKKQTLSPEKVFKNSETNIEVDSCWLDLFGPETSSTQTEGVDQSFKNSETETETNIEFDSCWLDLFGPATSSTQAEGADQSFKGSSRETLMHDDNDGQAMQSNKDTATSGIDEGRVFGYPDPWYDDEELPLMVADSQVLYMPFKDEQNVVDYVDFNGFFDDLEISEEPSKAECEAPSSFLSGDHEQNIDDVDFGSLFDEPEIFEGPPSKAEDSDHEVVVLDDSDSPVSVDRCLSQFTKPEILSEDNAWHCENCCKNLKRQRLREGIKTKENGASLASDECIDNLLNQDLENGYKEDEEKAIHDGILGDSDTKQPPVASSATESDKKEDEAVDSEQVIVKRAASKRVLVNKAPPVLTIHLKRFSQDARGRLSKLSGHVHFKEFIDLGQYMDSRLSEEDEPVYRLAGLVEHSGTMGRGHYVAYVRGGYKEKRNSDVQEDNSSIWYRASDSYVRRVSFEEVLCSEAYILFYQRI